MQNWKNIWVKKDIGIGDQSALNKLISADGFDTGFGTIVEKDWLSYTEYVSKKLGINKNDSIFEVGCGAGAFLYGFHNKNHTVAGIDYSPNLINIAKKHLPKGHFICDEAINIDHNTKYDIVLSNSVFFYFPSLSYAEKVLEKMIEKSKKSISILEVSNFECKEEALSMRKGNMTDEEYTRRYKGLDHLYYQKQWFINIAKKYNLKIEIEEQNINNYKNNSYRFNVFMHKYSHSMDPDKMHI